MLDEIWNHKRELHKLSVDADYLRKQIEKKLEGVDGFGPNIREHLRQWNQLIFESFENLNTVYDWIIEMLSQV